MYGEAGPRARSEQGRSRPATGHCHHQAEDWGPLGPLLSLLLISNSSSPEPPRGTALGTHDDMHAPSKGLAPKQIAPPWPLLLCQGRACASARLPSSCSTAHAPLHQSRTPRPLALVLAEDTQPAPTPAGGGPVALILTLCPTNLQSPLCPKSRSQPRHLSQDAHLECQPPAGYLLL